MGLQEVKRGFECNLLMALAFLHGPNGLPAADWHRVSGAERTARQVLADRLKRGHAKMPAQRQRRHPDMRPTAGNVA
jgi:hypothetical protein